MQVYIAVFAMMWICYLCIMLKRSMEELGRKTVEGYKQASKTPVTVILENVRSMHNVGSVFRTVDAFLLEQIILTGYTPQPPHRDIHKTALGATETVDWKYVATATEAIQGLQENGYTVFALEQTKNAVSLESFVSLDYPKLAVVLGNEVEGVSEEALAICNGAIEIPQLGMKHSLNVSVAAGILFWKLTEPYLQTNR